MDDQILQNLITQSNHSLGKILTEATELAQDKNFDSVFKKLLDHLLGYAKMGHSTIQFKLELTAPECAFLNLHWDDFATCLKEQHNIKNIEVIDSPRNFNKECVCLEKLYTTDEEMNKNCCWIELKVDW